MSVPLVSVITPTWQRHDLLLDRCVPSVRAQTYAHVEHVIVSDGPDEKLARRIGELASPEITYVELDEHRGPRWGSRARLRGLEVAAGDLIAYLDDDDAYRPGHVETLAGLLAAHPDAGFAYSLMASHQGGDPAVIGCDPPSFCNIGTPMIMHRRSLLDAGTWGPPSPAEDWELVERWLAAGVQYAFADEATVDVWPSAFW